MRNNREETSKNQRQHFFIVKNQVEDEEDVDQGRFEFHSNKKEKRRVGNSLIKYFRQYCEYSTIHGMKYVGEEQRSILERILWIAVLLLLFTCSTMLIFKAYEKWTNSPVIVTFATTETPISSIPFPAITICPEVKSHPGIFNFTDVITKKLRNISITTEEDEYFNSFFSICSEFELYKMVNGPETIRDFSVAKLLDALPESAIVTEWLTQEQTNVLAKIYTSAGVCTTFNMLDIQEILVEPADYMIRGSIENTRSNGWSVDDGYEEGYQDNSYPRRSYVPGIVGGFQILLVTNKNHLDYICRESFQGFMVTLHNPAEVPDMDQYFRVSLDHAVHARVTPRLITVSQELRSYSPSHRRCYFSNEQTLRYFKSYTQTNCFLECLTNYTYDSCGCVFNHMPKNTSMQICGPGKAHCLKEVRANFFKHYAQMDGQNVTSTFTCNCLPSCTSLNYDTETSQSSIQVQRLFDLLKISNQSSPLDTDKYHISALQVYFKEMQFMSTKRQELYGFVDFLANCGGLLGLFMGFSVTSLIEIIYFLSFRILCNVSNYGKGYLFGRKDASESPNNGSKLNFKK